MLDKLNLARLGARFLETVHIFTFSGKYYKRNPGAVLKLFLIKNLAGLGNIYTDLALFLAGLNPSRKVETLNVDEQATCWQSKMSSEGIWRRSV